MSRTPAKKLKWYQNRKFICSFPGCKFVGYRYNQLEVHAEIQHLCSDCGDVFPNRRRHRPHCPQLGAGRADFLPPPDQIENEFFKQSNRQHRGVSSQYEYIVPKTVRFTEVAKLIEFVYFQLTDLLDNLLLAEGGVLISLRLIVDLINIGTKREEKNVPIGSPWTRLTHSNFIRFAVTKSLSFIIMSLNYYSKNGSDWSVSRINSLQVLTGIYEPVEGRQWFKTPPELALRRGLLNIVSKEPICFKLCIAASIYGDEMANEKAAMRAKSNKYVKNVKAEGKNRKNDLLNGSNYVKYFKFIKFDKLECNESRGVNYEELDLFESYNPDISVCVYKYVNKQTTRLVRPTDSVKPKHVDLLFVKGPENQGHYILIKNKNKFFGKQGQPAREFCGSCSNRFTAGGMKRHVCGYSGEQPSLNVENVNFKFVKYQYTLRLPYVMYYSFQHVNLTQTNVNPNVIGELAIIGYCLMLVTPQGVELFETYYKEDPIGHFLSRALEIATDVVNRMKWNIAFKETPEIVQRKADAKVCEFCHVPFGAAKKIYHHSHSYGQLEAIVCVKCNSRARQSLCLNAVAFGNTKYDNQLVVRGFEADLIQHAFPVTRSDGSLVGLKINKILKLTSAENFRPGSTLQDLIEELIAADQEFTFVNQYFRNNVDEKLLHCDLPVPELDNIQQFEISLSDHYSRSIKWDSSEIKSESQSEIKRQVVTFNLQKYLKWSLKLRTLMLAQVFENHRNTKIENYKLDPLHFYGASGYAFESAFFMTKAQVDLVTDPVMLKMIQGGCRGGVVLLNAKHAESNTKRYGVFRPWEKPQEILSVDMTGQYSAAMTCKLPQSNFTWLTPEEIEALDFLKMTPEDDEGVIAEVTLSIPEELHDYFSDYPPVCEKRPVAFSDLSTTQQEFLLSKKKSVGQDRLLLTLYDKVEQTYLGTNIALFLKLGVKLVKVHRAIKFHQSAYLADFINFNSEKRKQAPSELLKNLYKLENNILSGRFQLDPMEYSKNQYCTTSVKCRKFFKNDKFLDHVPLASELSLFRMKKDKNVEHNFNVISFAIYEHAKRMLVESIYYKFKPMFGDLLKVVHSHTDSLLCTVELTGDEYIKRLSSLADIFDFSTLDKGHVLYSTNNRLSLGKFKMVDNISEFVGLRPGSYSIKLSSDKEIAKCSGISQKGNESLFRHQAYKDSLSQNNQTLVKVLGVRLVDDKILNMQFERHCFDGLDLSRYYIDNYYSLPFGHWRLKVDFKLEDTNDYVDY